jgi:hypothetical protein
MAKGWELMYFLDDTHLVEFLKLVSTYHKERSREYVAAYYLLTCEKDIRQKVDTFILPPQGVIDWALILKRSIDREKKMIIKLAFYLYSENNEFNINEVLNASNEKMNQLILQALDIRKNWPRCSYMGN